MMDGWVSSLDNASSSWPELDALLLFLQSNGHALGERVILVMSSECSVTSAVSDLFRWRDQDTM